MNIKRPKMDIEIDWKTLAGLNLSWNHIPPAEQLLIESLVLSSCSLAIGLLFNASILKQNSLIIMVTSMMLYMTVFKPNQDKAVCIYLDYVREHGLCFHMRGNDFNDYPGVKGMGGVEKIDNAVALYLGMDQAFGQ